MVLPRVDLLEEVDRHAQVHIAYALDGKSHGVLAGIEHAVLSGAVVLELQQVIAVFQGEDVLGLAGIHEILGHGGNPSIQVRIELTFASVQHAATA